MSAVDYKDLYEATNKGLDIIVHYYPDAAHALQRRDKKFKIRDERTASASLRLYRDLYRVTDFGGDQKERDAISICMLETGKEFYEAVQYLGSIFNVKGSSNWAQVKPEISRRALTKDEKHKDFEIKDKQFTEAELSLLGPKVTAAHCKEFNLLSLEHFTYCKETEAIVTASTGDYPIYGFEGEDWVKLYQPLSYEKRYRFRFLGNKPKRFLYGLELIQSTFKKNKKRIEDTYNAETDGDKEDPRLDYVFIVSGGSDGLNLRSFGYYPIWFNSESETLNYEEYKELKIYTKQIIYIPDLDNTGLKQSLEISLKYLDVKVMMLPHYLTLKKDKRGNSCKDFKDFVVHFYNKKDDLKFRSRLRKLIDNALPSQFWSEYTSKTGKNFKFRHTQFYNFLKLNGFGRVKDEHTKDGYHFVYVDGNVVKKVLPVEIEEFVHQFLKDRQMPTELRDLIYSKNLNENSLKKLDTLNIEFRTAERDCQFMFFENAILKITAQDVELKRRGEVDRYVWESKVLKHTIHLTGEQFKVKKDAHGNDDVEITEKNNMFLNFIINTCRIHWRKELEESLEKKTEEFIAKYKEENKFNIAGPNLSPEEIQEQKLHLINKLYAIGYMLHTYKSPQKPWAVYAMDNKVADIDESHGGSGKSIFQKAIQQILQKNHYIPGRDSNKTKDDFITHGITEDTDYILVDDCNKYLDYGFFFSWITGDLEVNNKNGLRFVIPFDAVPKIAFSSNYPPNKLDPSLARRLLYVVFSDYYHFNLEDEYNESRAVSDDFGGKSLFKDFDDSQWNLFYNFCAQCIQFFLSQEEKINPPMDNVTLRNLLSEMGETFKDWADVYFSDENNVNTLIIKDTAYEDLKQKTSTKLTPTNFKRRVKMYCDYMGWIFNPKDSEGYTNDGRILKKIDNKSTEMLFIRTETKSINQVISESNIHPQEVDNDDDLDDVLPFDQ